MRKLLAFTALGLVAAAAVVGLMLGNDAGSGEASSHREAPMISADPLADNTDVYAFRSPDQPNTVTLISNWIPLEEPAGGPNFHKFGDAPEYVYDLRIDNNGDAVEDITYEFRFKTQVQNKNTFLYATGPITSLNDPDFNIRQSYSITRIDRSGSRVLASNVPTPPVNIGPTSTPNYEALATAAIRDLGNERKVFAGQRDDPFFVDLGSIFDLATVRSLPGNAGGGVDGVGGFNTHTIALQVPISDLARSQCNVNDAADMDCVVGVWSTTKQSRINILKDDGSAPLSVGQVQTSRLGMPLVNEVVIPLGKKDRFNASHPRNDGQFLTHVVNPELAGALNALYGVGAPTSNRLDLVAVFLTGIPGLNQPTNVRGSEMIRLNVAVPPSGSPNRFGVLAGDNAGFPNGRRLADDVTDIELRAVCGLTYQIFVDPSFTPNAVCSQLGDGVDANDIGGGTFLSSFPYVQTPHQGFEHDHHPVGGAMAIAAASLGGAGMLIGLGLVAPRVLRRKGEEENELEA
jgi:hypothetical protein